MNVSCVAQADVADTAATGVASDSQAGRQTIPFDQGWRFAKGDIDGAEAIGLDDQSWQSVDLPHDWSIEGPFDKDNPASGEGGFLPTGTAFYRKQFSLPSTHEGRRVFVEFDGVMANSQVWVNGHSLGIRPNGYVTFRYDLTDHLNLGEASSNVLTVRTDTSQQVASRWYTGSGIYRHVRLLSVDPLRIDHDGVFVRPTVTPENGADLQIDVSISNDHKSACKAVVNTQIVDAQGTVVANEVSDLSIAAQSADQIVQHIKLPNAKRWDTETPYLYTAKHQIILDDEVVDSTSTRFGIRDAQFRADTGFWLNDRNLKIKGVCLHHCGGSVGAAVPLGVWQYRLAKLRQLGVNAIRTAHNPVAPEFLDLCDEMGFLVMDEFFDCWTRGKRKHDYHKFFNEWSHRDAKDTIVRDRNHPSVILYSVGNEIRDTHYEEDAKRILKGLVDVCHENDPTRPVTQGLFRPNVTHDYDNGLADLLDVIGTNYRDSELLQAWKDKPSRKIIGTEQSHERNTWLNCRDNIQHSGQFLWTGIDYLGEARNFPVTTYNSGLLDRTGKVCPRGYERQSWWADKPMVRAFRRIAPTEATPEDPGYETVEWKRRQVLFPNWSPRANEDAQSAPENVEVFTNCEEVELFLNEKSLGIQKLRTDAAPLNWTVPFSPGSLVAVGRNDGKEVVRDELKTAQEAHHLVLEVHPSTPAPQWTASDDVVNVVVYVVDAKGTRVPRANHEITFEVAGSGEVLGVDNSSIVSQELFKTNRRTALQGRCAAVVRATVPNAHLVITASAPGLKPATAEVGDHE